MENNFKFNERGIAQLLPLLLLSALGFLVFIYLPQLLLKTDFFHPFIPNHYLKLQGLRSLFLHTKKLKVAFLIRLPV